MLSAEPRIPVLFDTDIGTNVDDALALAYLLRQPRCELLGVTTASGDTAGRAEIAAAVCRAAGRAEVPVVAGSPGPLLVGPGQPDVPQHKVIRRRGDVAGGYQPGDAVAFMRRAIRARPGEVVLLAVAPTTNVALLFALDAQLPSLLRGVVSMGGVFFPGEGPDPRRDETNTRADPLAAAMVYAATARDGAAPHLSLGLDVTARCRLPVGDVGRRLASAGAPMDLVAELADEWLARTGRAEVAFHDPLAAAVVFRPELCAWEAGVVGVDVTPGAAGAGRTTFTASAGGRHRVARRVDVDAFFREFWGVSDRAG